MSNQLLPSIDLLQESHNEISETLASLEEESKTIESVFSYYGIVVNVVSARQTTIAALYEISIPSGVSVKKVISLQPELQMYMRGYTKIYIVPEKSLVGIEVTMPGEPLISLKELLNSDEWKNNQYHLPIPLGLAYDGNTIVRDITEMPHILLAGTTGSGKSVFLNSLITSLLMCKTPDDLKLVLIDPKGVELNVYRELPHALFPTIVNCHEATTYLEYLCAEMKQRFNMFAEFGVKNIQDYNLIFADQKLLSEAPPKKLPYILVVIDELADLMMSSANAPEEAICQLARSGRSVGIHLIIATQSPKSEIITPNIKNNMPCRISFKVTDWRESQKTLDISDAKYITHKGEMYFISRASKTSIHVQTPYLSDKEIASILKFYADNYPKPDYIELPMRNSHSISHTEDGTDYLYDLVEQFVIGRQTVSIGAIQRAFKVLLFS